MSVIEFFIEHPEFTFQESDVVAAWLNDVAAGYGYSIQELSYVFVTDEELWEMNREHLDHDTYTDIITFVLNEADSRELLIDIFISVDRVKENANTFEVSFVDELHRVMVHGLLHAMGMDDKEEGLKAEMRKAEDLALSLREF